MSTYKPPDKIDIYAAALQSDIGAERFEVVEGGQLRRYWIGTVYGGGVATAKGHKFNSAEEAWENASQFVERCAEIRSERRNTS